MPADHEMFQTRMIEGMADLRAKMNKLVGEDGNGGIMADQEERIRNLEKHRWRQSGIVSAIVSAAVSALFGGIGVRHQ